MAPKTRSSDPPKKAPRKPPARRPARSKTSSPRQPAARPAKRKASVRARVFTAPKRARTGSKEPDNAINFTLQPGAKLPAWETLPYQILLSIFQNAAYPLLDEQWSRRGTTRWLIRAATTCRSFLEPALAALYHGPPLVFLPHYHAFYRLILGKGPRVIDYRTKVHQLDFEVNYSRFTTFAPELDELIIQLPALRAFGLHKASDGPQPTSAASGTLAKSDQVYIDSWIKSLDSRRITRLKWHCLDYRHLYESAQLPYWALSLPPLHPSFRSIETLEIACMTALPDFAKDLARALSAMPSLRNLSLLRIDFFDLEEGPDPMALLSELPPDLECLEFVSCEFISARGILAALQQTGSKLRQLRLRHNRHANLTFLPQMADLCPSLEVFKYDLALFSNSAINTDAAPAFKHLLEPGEVPKWPKTLRELDLNQLRHWPVQAAEEFFKSLLYAAPNLPDLRKLLITASVPTGWRERITFRERIIAPLEQIYAKSTVDPAVVTAPRKNSRPTRGQSASSVEEPVHGKCDEVYIRVDNLRPTEEQKNEGDFLDSEQSGDEDYVD